MNSYSIKCPKCQTEIDDRDLLTVKDTRSLMLLALGLSAFVTVVLDYLAPTWTIFAGASVLIIAAYFQQDKTGWSRIDSHLHPKK